MEWTKKEEKEKKTENKYENVEIFFLNGSSCKQIDSTILNEYNG